MKELLSVRLDGRILEQIDNLQKIYTKVYQHKTTRTEILELCLCNGIADIVQSLNSRALINEKGEFEKAQYDKETLKLLKEIEDFSENWQDTLFGDANNE